MTEVVIVTVVVVITLVVIVVAAVSVAAQFVTLMNTNEIGASVRRKLIKKNVAVETFAEKATVIVSVGL